MGMGINTQVLFILSFLHFLSLTILSLSTRQPLSLSLSQSFIAGEGRPTAAPPSSPATLHQNQNFSTLTPHFKPS
jgi:hypothetical protein